MHAALLNPSKHIKGAAFGHDGVPKEPTYTIKSIHLEELEREDESMEQKGIIHFQEIDKTWVANVVNAKSLIAMFGTETDNWIGKRVTLWFDASVRAFGETVGGIRVRGSPDIPQPVSFMFKSMKKKKRQITLVKTGSAAPAARQQQAAAPKPPSVLARIQQLATEYEFPRGEKDADLFALIKKACPDRKSSAELTEDDFALVETAMADALGAGKTGTDGDPPISF